MRRVLSVMSMQGLPSAWRRLALGLLASCVLNSASWAQGVQAEPDSMWPDAPASDMALVRWLSSQPDFRLGVERDYGPFVFADEHGEPQGLSVDALALVSRHVGLRYITALQAPLGTLLQAARRGELDVLTSLRENAERSEFLLFTAPYASVPAVVVTREGARADDLGRLQGQSVGVGPMMWQH
jgi:ABC-type amino acid transport substrate-binding protein